MGAVDADAGTVALVSPKGRKITWSPGRWGGDQVETFDEVPIELRTGDQVQFTRNNRRAGRGQRRYRRRPRYRPQLQQRHRPEG